MAQHVEAGWAYGVKTPALAREQLWASIGRRLETLGMSRSVSDTFTRLYETSIILAGSVISIKPPPFRYGVDPRDYVLDELKTVPIEHELA